MPEEGDCGGGVDEAVEIPRVILVADDDAAEVQEPGEHAFNVPAAHVPAQRAPFQRGALPDRAVRRDHFSSELLHYLPVQPVAVIGFVADQPLRRFFDHALLQRGRNELHFSRRSALCPQGERKTMAVCNAHDLGAFAALGFPDAAPPFLAGTKVPSTKRSLRSSPPASLRCAASARRTFSITPERTQFWKRRCAVWYGPYRGGISFQGAPVRKTQRIPLKTLRCSLHG